MNWQSVAIDLAHASAAKLIALGGTFGLGGGVGIVKLLAHWPSPFQDNVYGGAFFDWLQDLVSNANRIGQRRSRSGVSVPAVPEAAAVPQPVAAPAEPLAKSGIERS